MGDEEAASDTGLEGNVGQRFDRLPETDADRVVEGRVSREGVLSYFEDRFGIPRETFEEYSFWEKGAGKIWIYAGEAPAPIEIEAIGMTCLRTRQEHWKPTTDFIQRFGHEASQCVIELTDEQATRFVGGQNIDLEWDGDWGYLVVTHEIAGASEPIGVGCYIRGTLQSVIPKGRQRSL